MAQRIFATPRTDPRFLLRKAMRVMARTLDQMDARSKQETVYAKGADGKPQLDIVLRAGGLDGKAVDSLTTLANTLHRLAKQADSDDAAIKRQVRGMTDEQLEEAERQQKSREHSEAIKEGLRIAALDKE